MFVLIKGYFFADLAAVEEQWRVGDHHFDADFAALDDEINNLFIELLVFVFCYR